MAIVNDLERVEDLDIDITDTSLASGMEQEMDLKEDWQARACPPPAGRYRLMLTIDKTDFKQGQKQNYKKDDPNGKYYKAQVTCKIQDPTGAWQDSIVYYNASTGIPKGKKVSTMAGLLVMMGDTKLPAKINEKALAQRFFQVVEKFKPVLLADCDWSTWDSTKGKNTPMGSALRVGMKNHPTKNVNGKVLVEHILQNAKGEDCIAKLKIVKWIGKGNTPTQNVASAPVKQPVQQVAAPQVVEMSLETPVADLSSGVSFSDDGEVILD